MGKETTVTRSMRLLIPCLVLHSAAVSYDWHTPPSQWDEPRLFHSSTLTADIEDRIALTKVSEIPTKPEAGANLDTLFSPNGAYWVAVVTSDTTELSEEPDQLCFYSQNADISAYIYNERDHLTGVSFINHYTNYNVTIEWINEKLLFFRVWWGRIAGSDLIIDVEAESIIWHEMVWWGGQAFQQYQQAADDAAENL
ncbi:hypothetical protein GF402_04130 [Candidatus Fermentibacteria bacterium]|nr:hypothetical protein [Candidatus Fermentibacteria bacterium]